MKLSKAQQEIVDKMREGWTLYSTHISWKVDPICFKSINIKTLNFLLVNGIIEYKSMYPHIYQLTEKYLNNEG